MGSMASLLLGVYVELCEEEDDSPPEELLVKCMLVRRARGPPSPRPGWNIRRTCLTLLDSSWSGGGAVKEGNTLATDTQTTRAPPAMRGRI